MLSWTVVTKSLVSFTALSLGAWAGILHSMLDNYFARRAARDAERRPRTVRAA